MRTRSPGVPSWRTPGMVSYTYRQEFAENFSETLDIILQLGITDMEFSSTFGLSTEQVRRELDARGMRCSSFGVSYIDVTSETERVAADALASMFHRAGEWGKPAWLPAFGC